MSTKLVRAFVLFAMLISLIANATPALADGKGPEVPSTEVVTVDPVKEQPVDVILTDDVIVVMKVDPSVEVIPGDKVLTDEVNTTTESAKLNTNVVPEDAGKVNDSTSEETTKVIVEPNPDEFVWTGNPGCWKAWFAFKHADQCQELVDAVGGENLDWSHDGLDEVLANASLTNNPEMCMGTGTVVYDPAGMMTMSDGVTSQVWTGLLGEGESNSMYYGNMGPDVTITFDVLTATWYASYQLTVPNPCWTPEEPTITITVKTPIEKPSKPVNSPAANVCITKTDLVANDGNGNFSITDTTTGKIWQYFTANFNGLVDAETDNKPCTWVGATKANGSDQWELTEFDYSGNVVRHLTNTPDWSEGKPVVSPNLIDVASMAFNRTADEQVVKIDAQLNYYVVDNCSQDPSWTSAGELGATECETSKILVLGDDVWTNNPLESLSPVQWSQNGEVMIFEAQPDTFRALNFAGMTSSPLPTADQYCFNPEGNAVCQVENGEVKISSITDTQAEGFEKVETVADAQFAVWGYESTTVEMDSAAFESRLQMIASQKQQPILATDKDENQILAINPTTSTDAVAIQPDKVQPSLLENLLGSMFGGDLRIAAIFIFAMGLFLGAILGILATYFWSTRKQKLSALQQGVINMTTRPEDRNSTSR